MTIPRLLEPAPMARGSRKTKYYTRDICVVKLFDITSTKIRLLSF